MLLCHLIQLDDTVKWEEILNYILGQVLLCFNHFNSSFACQKVDTEQFLVVLVDFMQLDTSSVLSIMLTWHGQTPCIQT